MKMKKIAMTLAAVMLAASVSACGGNTPAPTKAPEKNLDLSGMEFTVGAYRDLSTDPYNVSFGIGAKEFEEKYGAKVNFAIHKSNEDLVAAIASGDVWDVQMSIMSPTVTVFRQGGLFEPLDDYIDPNNELYTKKLMEMTDIYDGKTYGVSNVLMSDVLYCVYNESMFLDYGIKTPFEYWDEGAWNWDNFINMVDDLKKNDMPISIQWSRPFLDKRYGVVWNDDYTISSQYTGQEQRDWLNFVRTLVYDKGIGNSKGQGLTPATRDTSFVLQIIPHALVATANAGTDDVIRYIPMASKSGELDTTYLVDYSFCVPVGAKSIEGSVELSNYMIKGCVEDRTRQYKEAMSEEDYALFEKSLEDFYIVKDVENFWHDKDLITEFQQGATPAQLLSEVEDKLAKAVEDHNKKVAEKKAADTTSADK